MTNTVDRNGLLMKYFLVYLAFAALICPSGAFTRHSLLTSSPITSFRLNDVTKNGGTIYPHSRHRINTSSTKKMMTIIPTESIQDMISHIGREEAEAIAGPFFGASLFPYLAFLYFLNVPENETPKGVTVGFATCLLFVFLTIPAAIAAQLLYGVSLADSDWLHGSAESLLTVTNLVTVVAFRQALKGREKMMATTTGGKSAAISLSSTTTPESVISYRPMINLVIVLTTLASLTAFIPYLVGAEIHTPYLLIILILVFPLPYTLKNGILDLPKDWVRFGNHPEPGNALSIPCWIIHVSSLVEFLVAMGFAWRWADVTDNPKWKGLTWGLLPLHSSGITACTYHLFYNQIPLLVPLQAFLTCVGNTTAAYATWRIARSNGWTATDKFSFLNILNAQIDKDDVPQTKASTDEEEQPSLIGFEDLGDALAKDSDYSFLIKLFVGCGIASYGIKYGELFFDFPLHADLSLALDIILIPSLLNAFKWNKRSSDPDFEGWF